MTNEFNKRESKSSKRSSGGSNESKKQPPRMVDSTRERYSTSYQGYDAANLSPEEQNARMLKFMFPGYEARRTISLDDKTVQTDVSLRDLNKKVEKEQRVVLTVPPKVTSKESGVRTEVKPVKKLNIVENIEPTPRLQINDFTDELDGIKRVGSLAPHGWIGPPLVIKIRCLDFLFLEITPVALPPLLIRLNRKALENHTLEFKVVPGPMFVPQVIVTISGIQIYPLGNYDISHINTALAKKPSLMVAVSRTLRVSKAGDWRNRTDTVDGQRKFYVQDVTKFGFDNQESPRKVIQLPGSWSELTNDEPANFNEFRVNQLLFLEDSFDKKALNPEEENSPLNVILERRKSDSGLFSRTYNPKQIKNFGAPMNPLFLSRHFLKPQIYGHITKFHKPSDCNLLARVGKSYYDMLEELDILKPIYDKPKVFFVEENVYDDNIYNNISYQEKTSYLSPTGSLANQFFKIPTKDEVVYLTPPKQLTFERPTSTPVNFEIDVGSPGENFLPTQKIDDKCSSPQQYNKKRSVSFEVEPSREKKASINFEKEPSYDFEIKPLYEFDQYEKKPLDVIKPNELVPSLVPSTDSLKPHKVCFENEDEESESEDSIPLLTAKNTRGKRGTFFIKADSLSDSDEDECRVNLGSLFKRLSMRVRDSKVNDESKEQILNKYEIALAQANSLDKKKIENNDKEESEKWQNKISSKELLKPVSLQDDLPQPMTSSQARIQRYLNARGASPVSPVSSDASVPQGSPPYNQNMSPSSEIKGILTQSRHSSVSVSSIESKNATNEETLLQNNISDNKIITSRDSSLKNSTEYNNTSPEVKTNEEPTTVAIKMEEESEKSVPSSTKRIKDSISVIKFAKSSSEFSIEEESVNFGSEYENSKGDPMSEYMITQSDEEFYKLTPVPIYSVSDVTIFEQKKNNGSYEVVRDVQDIYPNKPQHEKHTLFFDATYKTDVKDENDAKKETDAKEETDEENNKNPSDDEQSDKRSDQNEEGDKTEKDYGIVEPYQRYSNDSPQERKLRESSIEERSAQRSVSEEFRLRSEFVQKEFRRMSVQVRKNVKPMRSILMKTSVQDERSNEVLSNLYPQRVQEEKKNGDEEKNEYEKNSESEEKNEDDEKIERELSKDESLNLAENEKLTFSKTLSSIEEESDAFIKNKKVGDFDVNIDLLEDSSLTINDSTQVFNDYKPPKLKEVVKRGYSIQLQEQNKRKRTSIADCLFAMHKELTPINEKLNVLKGEMEFLERHSGFHEKKDELAEIKSTSSLIHKEKSPSLNEVPKHISPKVYSTSYNFGETDLTNELNKDKTDVINEIGSGKTEKENLSQNEEASVIKMESSINNLENLRQSGDMSIIKRDSSSSNKENLRQSKDSSLIKRESSSSNRENLRPGEDISIIKKDSSTSSSLIKQKWNLIKRKSSDPTKDVPETNTTDLATSEKINDELKPGSFQKPIENVVSSEINKEEIVQDVSIPLNDSTDLKEDSIVKDEPQKKGKLNSLSFFKRKSSASRTSLAKTKFNKSITEDDVKESTKKIKKTNFALPEEDEINALRSNRTSILIHDKESDRKKKENRRLSRVSFNVDVEARYIDKVQKTDEPETKKTFFKAFKKKK